MSGITLDQISAEQQKVLEIVSAWANRYACIKTVTIFGSVARGDARPDSDLDLYVGLVDHLASDRTLVEAYTQFQTDIKQSKCDLAALTGRQVSPHGGLVRDWRGEDGAVAWIRDGTVIAQLGKAIIVATQRKPLKPDTVEGAP